MKKIMLAAVLTVGLTGTAFAEVDKEAVVNYRQSIFDVAGWNMGTLAGMVKGEIPYDETQAKNAAVRLHEMAKASSEVFIDGTFGSENNSHAKTEISSKRDDFNKKMEAFAQESKAMLTASAKKATLGPQLGKLGQTCKSCHDAYRAD